ncbi:MAG TPA: outer membrane beta-barrel protein [Candidatus Polarisedimenticolia bacterium]|jgi:hypothetical protein|nr:outer membrane beta-barrel protein [Candidatus Polarisedimenticolia bacterium]
MGRTRRGHGLGRAGAILLLLAVTASPTFAAEKPVKVDVGGGVAIQDFASDSGGVGPDPRGIFMTVGLVQRRGIYFRVNAGISSDEVFAFTDLGLGAEPAVDSYDLTRLEASVGYVFNQRGVVRLFVHGGYSLISVQEKLKGKLSGLGRTQIDDSATAISLGAGVEIGDGHHILIFDLGADPQLEFKTSQGTTAKFSMGGVYAGYVYQF